jgi:hypothetical protein
MSAQPSSVTASGDQVTILHARKNLSKLWRADGKIESYDSAKLFEPQVFSVSNGRELSTLLTQLESKQKSCIIRGRFVGLEEAARREDLSGLRSGTVLRRKTLFEDQPLHTVLIEVDDFQPTIFDPMYEPEREAAIGEYIAARLPACFHKASFHWQLSNSFGHPDKPGLRVHLWFWLATPRTSAELKAWAKAIDLKADRAVFDEIQVHYTANPRFESGVADPVVTRSGFHEGTVEAVDLEIGTAIEPVKPRKKAGEPSGELRTEISPEQLADLKSALAHRKLLEDAAGEPICSEIGLALLSLGRELHDELFRDLFCPRAGNYDAEWAAGWWDAHSSVRVRSDYRHVFTMSSERGWVNPSSPRAATADDFDVQPTSTEVQSPLERYYAYLPQHMYIDRATRQLFPAPSVDGSLRGISIGDLKPTAWLDKHRAVHQMTWDPGRGEIIEDEIVAAGGWQKSAGQRVFNQYRAAPMLEGDASKVDPWLDHLKRIYPDEYEHIVRWLAHRVQRPGDKINHAIVLGGSQGIGKDTALAPVKAAVGSWNWEEITPVQMLGRFNGWVKSVVVRVNEARDLGEVDRFAFYDHAKSYIAAPPDVLRVDEKHTREYPVLNVLGMIITTNHKLDGIYLPGDDRRHYVAWSAATKQEFDDRYWQTLWVWYETGGLGHVAAYLRTLDLTGFNPKAAPPKTPAFYEIVACNNDPEEGELTSLLDEMGNPATVTIGELRSAAMSGSGDSSVSALFERKERRAIPHKLERAGYVSVRNPGTTDGRWKVDGKNQTVYARRDLALADQLRAVRQRARS